jgi:hypothetical protein
VLLTPLQTSATSQMPTDARQLAVLLLSAGQVALPPVQVSCRSQAPPEARQTVVLLLNWHVDEQHDGAPPLPPPRSHTSLPKFVSAVPSPQLEV